MRKAVLGIASLLCAGLVIGCSGNGKSTTSPGAVPVVLTIQNQAGTGTSTLSYSIEVTGVSLQGSTSNQSNVSLLSSPVTVNLDNLQSINTLLNNTSAAAGTYSGIMITFAMPQISLLNNTGSNLTDGTTTCASSTTTSQPCVLSPALTQSSVTITSSPFPLTLTAGTPVNLAIDFNTAASIVIASGSVSITPSVTVTSNSTVNATTNNLNDFSNITGQVTSASNNQVTVTDLSTGQPLTLATNSSTTYTGYNTSATCTTANTFACIQAGNIINFSYGITGASGSVPTLESLNFNAGVTNGLTGTVLGPLSNGTFPVLITSETPAYQGSNGSMVGETVLVSPATGATFQPQLNGGTEPAGVSFASSADLVPGQTVLLDSTGFTAGTGTGPGTLTTDNVTLIPSQFNGTINTLDASNQTLTLNGLGGLYTTNGINAVNVNTTSGTFYTGVTGGFTGLTAGTNATFGGLLYNTPASPTIPTLEAGQIGVTTTTAAAATAVR
jgi:hypothetical protein